jgi:hypothetical protein
MRIQHLGPHGGPHDLPRHPQLEPEVKRAILSSWASDAYTARSRPTLRKPPGLARPVRVSEVLDALKSLDVT